MQRHAHRIEAGIGYEADILRGYISIPVRIPKAFRLVRPEKTRDDRLDLARRSGNAEFEHVAFRHQPIAQADALDGECPSIGVDEALAIDVDETAGRRYLASDRACRDGGEQTGRNQTGG